ncbi:MAG: signal peptide peptidase SppA [Pseudomonadota bacterium]
MRTFLFASLGAFVGTMVGLILLVMIAIGSVRARVASMTPTAQLPDTYVLEMDLRQEIPDQSPLSGPAAVFGPMPGFIDILMRLEAAKTDDNVAGVFIRGAEFGIGSARSEELRAALLDFKSDGKFVLAHSQGTYGGGPSVYRALASADEIWVQPGSELIASGITLETLFMRDLFDNLSITPQFEAFHEYKNAPNTYTEAGYTDAHRLALADMAVSLWNQSLGDIASDRGLSVAEVTGALEATPLNADDMIALGLADQNGWPEDAMDAALDRAGEDAGFVSINKYVPPSSKFGSPTIALVGGNGAIVTGGNGGSIFSEGSGFASDSIAAAILEAGSNERVDAIVFRVDSPGGSPTASDQIWRAIERVQDEYEVPVVVSMASVAASGGYYVSTGADWIVANRATITGSIGIFGGKFAIAEGLARIGVNAETISVGGPFSGVFSTTQGLTEAQRDMMREWLGRGYDRFIALVAEGRGMSAEEVDARARGRVWTGEDAMSQGLVDELGGLTTAIAKARELAEIEPDEAIRILKYPQFRAPFPFAAPGVSETATDLSAIGELTDILRDPRVQSVIEELEATRSGHLQVRAPAVSER